VTVEQRRREVEQIARMLSRRRHADRQGRIADGESFVIDLLAGIRHFCDGRGLDFGQVDRLAYGRYLKELGEERARQA
jgi:hypothetical protein